MSSDLKSFSIKGSVDDAKALLSSLNTLKDSLGRDLTENDVIGVFLQHATFATSSKGKGRAKSEKVSPAVKNKEHKAGCCVAKIHPKQKKGAAPAAPYFCNAKPSTGTNYCTKHRLNHISDTFFEKKGQVKTLEGKEYYIYKSLSGQKLAMDRKLMIQGRAKLDDEGDLVGFERPEDDDIAVEETQNGNIKFRCFGRTEKGTRCDSSGEGGKVVFCARHSKQKKSK